jgi:hypothetical protein
MGGGGGGGSIALCDVHQTRRFVHCPPITLPCPPLQELSNWPTYPQLYVRGELVGGCDIVLEMAAEGELKETIDEMKARI